MNRGGKVRKVRMAKFESRNTRENGERAKRVGEFEEAKRERKAGEELRDRIGRLSRRKESSRSEERSQIETRSSQIVA